MDILKLVNELHNNNYVKKSIKDIAKKYNLSETELKKIYTTTFFKEVLKHIDLSELAQTNIDQIEKKIPKSTKSKFEFIKTDLTKIIEKSLYIATKNGFTLNINQINSGVMTANAGDSAEFIFVARAILAGFNCSSVDVRSSRYDAIIDFNDKLLRVQIKGISTANSISFKDRDRGGQGIDHKHKTNIGQRITSKDCDLYVAVDKQVGICYIVPMKWVDTLKNDEIKNLSISKINQYKENWQIIKDLTSN